MENAKHTQEESVLIKQCQNSHTFAKDTAKPSPTLPLSEQENIKVLNAPNVSVVEQTMLKDAGMRLNSKQLSVMAEDAFAAANHFLNFLQSTTLEEMGTNIENRVTRVINFTNCSNLSDSQKRIIDCFATIVIAPEDNLVNVPTNKENLTSNIKKSTDGAEKVNNEANARLIAAAPTTLKTLTELAQDIHDFRLDMENSLEPSPERLNVMANKADAAISKATSVQS